MRLTGVQLQGSIHWRLFVCLHLGPTACASLPRKPICLERSPDCATSAHFSGAIPSIAPHSAVLVAQSEPVSSTKTYFVPIALNLWRLS